MSAPSQYTPTHAELARALTYWADLNSAQGEAALTRYEAEVRAEAVSDLSTWSSEKLRKMIDKAEEVITDRADDGVMD